MNIQTHIKDVLRDSNKSSHQEPFGEQDMLQALREKGVVDDVMRQLQFKSGGGVIESDGKPATHFVDRDDKVQLTGQPKTANIDPTRRYLFIQILGGRAFLEHVQDGSPLPGQPSSFFTLHVHFRGQRFKSRPTPCACEPDIQEGFLLELHKESAGDAARMAGNSVMLSLCDPIHLVLIKTEPTGETSLVSSNFLEWRQVLSAPNSRCTRTIEFMGVGQENKVPVGILEMRMELIPRVSSEISEEVVAAQLALQKNRQAERERLFLVYAKQWWKEFLQIRSGHKERLVKIFAQDENGNNRPVCSYVKPLRAGRLIDTPREAARFVSLVGYEKVSALGGGEHAEQWTSMHAFLCRNKGDCEDHAALLCSILLGFGLDAFMCVGTKSKGSPHVWVMTISNEGNVTFWESLTGHRYLHKPINPQDPPAIQQPRPSYPYKTIGCVFNHESFYGNSQPTDLVETCQFVLQDESKWKAMSPDAVNSVCSESTTGSVYPSLPPLCGTTLDGALVSNDLEQELRYLVMQHRRDQGLTTTWDDQLSYLLTPALSSYETERLTGITAGNEEFQQAIRRAVPDGHTFKGYPIQFVHRNGRRAFSSCLKSPVCEEIINCRGDHVRLAVRVRVFTYPESACATWIMFACKYKSVL